jgi:hypothetical protein
LSCPKEKKAGMDPRDWSRFPMTLVQYTTEFLNVVEEGWIVWWKNWKRTTQITITNSFRYTIPRKEKRVNKVIHSLGDICSGWLQDGDKEWWWQGRKHREGGKPAEEWSNGTKKWWWYGKLHREGDKPAVEYADGYKAWLQHGKWHREGDEPAVEECASGYKAWYRHGKYQRSTEDT